MALSTSATVQQSNGLGPKTYVCSVATATVSVADACQEIMTEGGTIAAVEGTADGNHIVVQGGPVPAVNGVTVVATFDNA